MAVAHFNDPIIILWIYLEAVSLAHFTVFRFLVLYKIANRVVVKIQMISTGHDLVKYWYRVIIIYNLI